MRIVRRITFLIILCLPLVMTGCGSGPRLPKIQSDTRSALSNANQEYANQHPEEALHLVLIALRNHQLLGDLSDSVRDMNRIGYIETSIGEYPKALFWFQRAELLSAVAKDPLLMAQTKVLASDAEISLHNTTEASILLKEVQDLLLHIPESPQKVRLMAHFYNSRGMLRLGGKHYKSSLSSFRKALSINQKLGLKGNAAGNWANIGNVYLAMKNPPMAKQAFDHALIVDRKIGNPEGIAFDSEGLSLAEIQTGSWDQALQSILAAYQIRLQQHNPVQAQKDLSLFRLALQKHPIQVNSSLLPDWPAPSP
ncbi:MAG: tetratricopeptide repeat protein [Leptospirillum sp.]